MKVLNCGSWKKILKNLGCKAVWVENHWSKSLIHTVDNSIFFSLPWLNILYHAKYMKENQSILLLLPGKHYNIFQGIGWLIGAPRHCVRHGLSIKPLKLLWCCGGYQSCENQMKIEQKKSSWLWNHCLVQLKSQAQYRVFKFNLIFHMLSLLILKLRHTKIIDSKIVISIVRYLEQNITKTWK